MHIVSHIEFRGVRRENLTEQQARDFVIEHAPGTSAAREAAHPQSGLWAADAQAQGFSLGVWRGRTPIDLEGQVTMVVWG